MKNIIIGPAFPLRGGIANFNEALCKAYGKKQIESSIVSFSLQYPSFLFPGKTQFDNGYSPEGLKIETIINSINPFNWIKIALHIKKQEPDYVIIRYWLPFMGPCLGTIARIIKWNTNIKVIAITDNVIPHEKRIGDTLFTRYFVKCCDGFIAMSQSVLHDLKTFTENTNTRLIPHPIYDIFGEKVNKQQAQQNLNLNTKDKHILFFGFIRNYKGLDLLLKAMADSRIKALGIKLIVAGEFYEKADEYEKIIQENSLQSSVILHTHYIDSNKVKDYFCAADMIVQPYKTATQSGITQIAYHFERPILVTNTGGLAEIVSHNKVGYVTEINPTEISNSLIDFYSNNRENEFSANVKFEKKRFEWSTMVEGIDNLLADLYK